MAVPKLTYYLSVTHANCNEVPFPYCSALVVETARDAETKNNAHIKISCTLTTQETNLTKILT